MNSMILIPYRCPKGTLIHRKKVNSEMMPAFSYNIQKNIDSICFLHTTALNVFKTIHLINVNTINLIY